MNLWTISEQDLPNKYTHRNGGKWKLVENEKWCHLFYCQYYQLDTKTEESRGEKTGRKTEVPSPIAPDRELC